MSGPGSLRLYGELADVLGLLPLLVREARRARGLTIRAAADEVGLAHSSLHRIEQGEDCRLSSALLVLAWLELTS